MKMNSTWMLVVAGASALALGPTTLSAQINLGTSADFAVLAGTSVTDVALSTITGDLGISPGSTLTGLTPGSVSGTIHLGDTAADSAQFDAGAAFNGITALPIDVDLTGQDLGGMTLLPGVYGFSTSAPLTGALTLDALGSPSAVFVIRIGTTLTTTNSASVVLLNGATACNVFWQVGSSATLGGSTSFSGTLLAATTITVGSASTVSGRLLALSGSVDLDANDVALPTGCACPGPAAISASIGTGCNPATDPVLSSTLPVSGTVLTLALQAPTHPSSYFVIYASTAPVAANFVPGTLCTAYVDYSSPTAFILVTESFLDANGNWSATFPIGTSATLLGLGFNLQAFVYAPLSTNVAVPYLFSNGLFLRIGC